MSENRKEVLKKFTREFDRSEEGNNKRVHGYHYMRYINLYIYNMKELLNKVTPEPHSIVKPTGGDYDVVDEVVRMYSTMTAFNGIDMDTSDYHAKVLTAEDTKKILSLKEDLNLPDLPKTVVPFPLARKTILKNPGKIAVIDCPCRKVRGEDGCKPLDVCLVLGEPWADFAVEYGEENHAHFITPEEALKIVDDQHKAGNVQAIFWKASENDRTYAICNCCTCCCTALQSYNYAGAPMFASSGYKAEVDLEKCIGCGLCTKTCKFFALEMDGDKVKLDADACMGCGVCVDKCPSGAFQIVRDDPTVSEPLDVDELIPKYTQLPAEE